MANDPDKSPGWMKSLVDLLVVVLIVTAAKTAIAEPFYVPSGSMEPTLLIGDELLATKYPYGYSSASLPSFITLRSSDRFLGALPERGDIVVFRYPGDRSQFWVKRVVGLPGDRIALRDGVVSINGTPAALKADGSGEVENDDGSRSRATRFIETLPRKGYRFIAPVNGTHPAPQPPVRRSAVMWVLAAVAGRAVAGPVEGLRDHAVTAAVAGEPQILSQVKQAYQLATEQETTGPLLHTAFQAALKAARRVASETAIQQRRVSIPSVAVADFAQQIFERFDDKNVLVIGAGEMAEEVIRPQPTRNIRQHHIGLSSA